MLVWSGVVRSGEVWSGERTDQSDRQLTVRQGPLAPSCSHLPHHNTGSCHSAQISQLTGQGRNNDKVRIF